VSPLAGRRRVRGIQAAGRGPALSENNIEGDHMIIRTVLAVAAVALGVTAVIAQQGPIAARRGLFKANGQEGPIHGKKSEGEEPFDLAKAKKIFATFEDASTKAPALFPNNSKTGGDTAALPAIWENKADFNAKLAKLGSDAKKAEGAIKDLDTFKAQFTEV